MKTLFSFLLILISSTFAFAQEESEFVVPVEDGNIIYAEVVEVPQESAKELYNRTIAWMDNEFTNARRKIDKKNAEKPMLVYDGEFRMNPDDYGSTEIKYKAKFEYKEGKFRYQIYKLHIDKGYFYGLERWFKESELPKEEAISRFKTIEGHVTKLIDSFKSYISSPPEAGGDDW